MRIKVSKPQIFAFMFVISIGCVRLIDLVRQAQIESQGLLPRVQSDSNIIIVPSTRNEMHLGGSGPDGPSDTENNSRRLENLDLQNISLSGADFREGRITNSDFTGGKLKDSNFTQADIFFSGFSKADLLE